MGNWSLLTRSKLRARIMLSIAADKIIIATGSEPRNFLPFPFDYERIHDSTSLLALTTLPKKILIIGGGVIGCEFASLYAHLGVDVTILELLPRIISTEAQEISQALTRAFNKKGIKVETEVKVQKIERTQTGVEAIVEGGKAFKADCCLVAVGRSLNTNNIGLDKAGVLVQENGLIVVNDKMETTVMAFMQWEILLRNGGWLMLPLIKESLLLKMLAASKHACFIMPFLL